MDPNSVGAAINTLYESIRRNPYILDEADKIPFVDTLLHNAASTGQTRLAVEIMNLKPSLSRKLNPNGLSPLHLALSNGHLATAKALIKLDKDLVRVKGRDCVTPLHRAAEAEDRVDILAEFLCACPESIEDQNAQGETPLHIATRNRNARALEVLMGWIRRTAHRDSVKYIKDGRGNTILHMAVSTSQPNIVNSVVREYRRLHINERNLDGDTALDIAERLAAGIERTKIESSLRRAGALNSSSLANDKSLVDTYLLPPRSQMLRAAVRQLFFVEQGMSLEMRNAILVVAVLIATATFQAAVSPPGGSGGFDGLGKYNSSVFGDESYINATMSISSTSLLPTTNISHINVTIFTKFTSRDKLQPTLFNFSPNGQFYAVNTIAYIISIVMIMIVVPFKVFFLLHLALLCLSFGYGLSFFMTNSVSLAGSSINFVASSIIPYFLLFVVHVNPFLQQLLRVCYNRAATD